MGCWQRCEMRRSLWPLSAAMVAIPKSSAPAPRVNWSLCCRFLRSAKCELRSPGAVRSWAHRSGVSAAFDWERMPFGLSWQWCSRRCRWSGCRLTRQRASRWCTGCIPRALQCRCRRNLPLWLSKRPNRLRLGIDTQEVLPKDPYRLPSCRTLWWSSQQRTKCTQRCAPGTGRRTVSLANESLQDSLGATQSSLKWSESFWVRAAFLPFEEAWLVCRDEADGPVWAVPSCPGHRLLHRSPRVRRGSRRGSPTRTILWDRFWRCLCAKLSTCHFCPPQPTESSQWCRFRTRYQRLRQPQ